MRVSIDGSWKPAVSTRDRATFDAAELAVVLSHYDLGVIESITAFGRGSRQSPKVGVVCERGKFLLKRLASARTNPDRIRFSHQLQAHLAAKNFPVSKLIPTRDGRRTHVGIRSHVYELFDFVAGESYRASVEETTDAGMTLGRFHLATVDFDGVSTLRGLGSDYHDENAVPAGLSSIGSTLSSHDSFAGEEAELASLTLFLHEAYEDAAAKVNRVGFQDFPSCVVHSDWHPGNLLFRGGLVTAVVDYDSARISRAVSDVANGALQFSMLGTGDPAGWPDELDEPRLWAFLEGYCSTVELPIAQRAAVPELMIEALIAECVPPITKTGLMGRWPGFRMLQMVRRKVRWLTAQSDRLRSLSERL